MFGGLLLQVTEREIEEQGKNYKTGKDIDAHSKKKKLDYHPIQTLYL